MLEISSSEYAQRRQHLLTTLESDAIALFFAAAEIHLSADRECTYQPDPDFYYLSGFKEPNAVLAFIPHRAEGEFVMFTQQRNVAAEQWTGRRVGTEGAVKHYGADQAFAIEDLSRVLPELLANRRSIYYTFGTKPAVDSQVFDIVKQLRRQVRSGIDAPTEIKNIDAIVHDMRLIKSPQEIALMQRSADIAVNAHQRAMHACQAGLYEYQLRAELDYTFLSQGAKGPAYDSIVGGGDNACILHYTENSSILKSGDLVLIDAGCEYQYYASDITRTFPVNGRYSPEQKAIYNLVLKAQLAVIDMIKPGLIWDKMQAKIVEIFVEGLVELGILQGNIDDLIKTQAYLPFYMHKSGHWLGLDTHDVGSYKIDGAWRPLQANMVLTVEPGLYISANTPNIDPKWYGIGIRIEDDVVVTETGCHVLSQALAKTVEEIEALIGV
jgi:Xaa-Pro aminopeptidase